jgi:hypothetical protein
MCISSHWFLAIICFPYLVGSKASSSDKALKTTVSTSSRAASNHVKQQVGSQLDTINSINLSKHKIGVKRT